MELLNNVIQNCVAMIVRLKNKKEMLQLQENCYDEDVLKELENRKKPIRVAFIGCGKFVSMFLAQYNHPLCQ